MILVDIFEPDLIALLISQSVEVQRHKLNMMGFADYMWYAVDGHSVMVERKQWGEILSSMDRVEEQLRRELPKADELNLLIEGVASPTPYGMDVYTKSKDKPYWRVSHSYGNPKRANNNLYARMQSWLWQLDKSGITIRYTVDAESTAITLVSCFKNNQKEEHKTLNRYIKLKPQLSTLNKDVLTLMGIEGADLGEVRAKALVDKFGCLYSLCQATVDEIAEVDGMGQKTAMKLLRAIGREE